MLKPAYEMRISDWSSDVCSSDRRMVCKVQRLLDRGIAAADHRDLLAAIEEAVARRAGGNAFALHRFLAVEPQPFGLRAGGDDEHVAFVHVAAVAGQPERTPRQIDIDDRIPDEARSEEHTSELQSLMRTSYAAFCLKNTNILIQT